MITYYPLQTSSNNFPDHAGKTIFNNLKNDVSSLIILLCESKSNNSNDIINKNQLIKLLMILMRI